MANQFKLTQKVANRLLLILKNQLVMGRLVDAGLASKFKHTTDEVPFGSTIYVRRPPAFVAQDGPVFVDQDIVVGSVPVTINKQKHVGFTLSEFERVLDYDGDSFLNDAVANAKMVAIAQQIDTDLMKTVLQFAGWVGTPGHTINTIAGFNSMPQRMDEMAIPSTDRNSVLSAADWWALAGAFTGAIPYDNDINKTALLKAKLPMIGNINPYMSQSVLTLTTGSRTNGAVVGANQSVNYADVKDIMSQTLNVNGLGANATVKTGEVLNIAGVFAVNPKTQQAYPYLLDIAVLADAVADGTGAAALTVTPIIAATGAGTTLLTNQAFQNASAVPAAAAAVTFKGAAATNFVQNASFHKEAIKLVYAKPAKPHTGEFTYATDPETGVTIRLWAFSDGTQDTHSYRADAIYGVANADPRLGVRGSGA